MPLLGLVLPLLFVLLPLDARHPASAQDSVDKSRVSSLSVPPGGQLIDDFEDGTPGAHPENWFYVERDKDLRTVEEALESGEVFEIRKENGNRFIRAETRDEAMRFTIRNGKEFEWNLSEHPRLQWRWRANQLPENASEKGQNDTGAAVYVTFGSDWLGRPKSIKYTYSSALPVGTVVSFGPLKVIVADSAREPRMGKWKTVSRRIADDYRQVFGGSPPDKPLSITLWSDSDTTDGRAVVDFDDLMVLPPVR